MNGARVYNRVDRVPAEMRLLGYRLGAFSMSFAALSVMIVAGLFAGATWWLGLIVAIVLFAVFTVIVKTLDTVDENKVLSETTALRLLLRAIFARSSGIEN